MTLSVWFHAIGTAFYYRTIGAANLATGIGIGPVPTARTMLSKIHAAILATDASHRWPVSTRYICQLPE